MKKLLKILAVVVGLFLAAIVIIPLVIDVDKYRPDIEKAANAQLNGTLELGKLNLSLWGKVNIVVSGLSIKDAQKKTILSAKDASFNMPYLSVLSGSPLITLTMKEPEINVIKGKDGKLNLMSLAKVGNVAQASASTPTQANTGAEPSKQKVELPAIAMNAHFGLFVENAKVVYMDEIMALSNTIDQLNLRVKDFSLSRKTELELWADLKTQMGTDLHLEGPLKLIAELKPEISGGELKSASLVATFTADDLSIEKGELFHKKKGIPMNFAFDGALSQDSLKLTNAAVKFHNAEIVVKGEYHKENGANINFEAKPIELKSWSELVPMLKAYELEGALGLVGDVKGKPEALTYNAKLTIKNLAMKGPNLKAKPVINGEVQVATDKIEKFLIDLKGPGNELILDGKLYSFTKPQLSFSVRSPKGMDLDQWIEFPKPEATSAASAPAAGKNDGKASEAAPVADYDAMLEPLRKNQMIKDFVMDGSVDIAFLKAKGMRIDNIGVKIQMKNLVAALTNLHMKMFDGAISGGFTTDLKPAAPQYNMSLVVSGLDMQKALESQFQSFKNTMTGKLSTSMQGGGSSFNVDQIKRKLQLKGDFKIVNAEFKTIDVAKMASDGISGAVSKMGDKIPMLKGKNVNAPQKGGSKYELVSSSFTINNGILDAPNFVAKAAPKSGIDLRGSTKMGLIDESLDAKWELVDTQKVTGADQVSVNISGKNINNILAKSEKDPVVIPITVGCKWSAPCPNYSQVAEYLAGVATKRLSGAAGDVAKAAAQDAVKKAVGDQVGNSLKKLFGR